MFFKPNHIYHDNIPGTVPLLLCVWSVFTPTDVLFLTDLKNNRITYRQCNENLNGSLINLSSHVDSQSYCTCNPSYCTVFHLFRCKTWMTFLDPTTVRALWSQLYIFQTTTHRTFHASFEPSWHPNNKQTNQPTSFSSSQTSVSAYDLPAPLKNVLENESHCRLSVWQKAESSLLWRGKKVLDRVWCPLCHITSTSPSAVEQDITACKGGLVIFLFILHFISIPPFKTQHENWSPQGAIFNRVRAHKFPNFEAGCRHKQIPFIAKQSYISAVRWEEQSWMGLLFSSGKNKKYTCYLVNPQTCKIGISWMSEKEMELTRDLFIVTEGH